MKRTFPALLFFALIAIPGVLLSAVPASGPSDAFPRAAARPAFIPVITEGESISITMDEDSSPTAFMLTLHATDGDNDPLTWGIYSDATHGNPSVSGGTGTSKDIYYVPAANYNGSDSFVVRVIDGVDGADTITVNVTINPRNDPPVNTVAPTVSGTRHVGQMLTGTTGTWNDNIDLVPGALTYSYQWQRADDAAGGNAIDIPGATATSYTVVAADNLKYLRFRVTATDDGEGLRLGQHDGEHVWQPDERRARHHGRSFASVTLDEDGSPTPFSLTLHATDVDADILSWSVSTAALHGAATASGTGTSKVIGYTPAADYNCSDSFVVQVDDGLGGTDTITVNATVNARTTRRQ
jgi:hypothetical protein